MIVVQQGQNIGISESTYRELKKLAGEKPRDLMLDEAGEKIHVVYQQDQASKARPLDWYLCSSRPYVHIGQALMGHNYITREQTYPPREIVSEEREALTGAYRQGRYENLIVFSDTYFESVKDCWKTTDLLTGEPVSEEEAVPDVTIHEWPTRLMLVNVPEKEQERRMKSWVSSEKAMPSTRHLIRWLRVPISVQTPGTKERRNGRWKPL